MVVECGCSLRLVCGLVVYACCLVVMMLSGGGC